MVKKKADGKLLTYAQIVVRLMMTYVQNYMQRTEVKEYAQTA